LGIMHSMEGRLSFVILLLVIFPAMKVGDKK